MPSEARQAQGGRYVEHSADIVSRLVRWLSGRKRHTRNVVSEKSDRGFESHPHRRALGDGGCSIGLVSILKNMSAESLKRENLETGIHEGFEGQVFEHVLEGSRFVGMGKDAVVFRLSDSELSEEEAQQLTASGVLLREDVTAHVAKLLKVYKPGEAIRERSLHARAFEILQQGEVSFGPLCKVPDVSVAAHQDLTPRARELLRTYDAQFENEAEFLLMEYVNGKDLGTIMYDFVLSADFDEETLSLMTYEQKETEVGRIVGFELPGADGVAPQDLQSMHSITFARNEEKLIKYLRKKGFTIPVSVIGTLERTVRVLHEHGFYHNDIHRRNVMLGSDGSVFLIDFGRSGTSAGATGALDDMAGIKMWKPLTMTEETEKSLQRSRDKQQWLSMLGRMCSSEKYGKRIAVLADGITHNGLVGLEKELHSISADDTKLEHFFLMLRALLDRDDTKDVTRDFIATLQSSAKLLRTPAQLLLRRFIESGFWDTD